MKNPDEMTRLELLNDNLEHCVLAQAELSKVSMYIQSSHWYVAMMSLSTLQKYISMAIEAERNEPIK
jgi:hypothetical protein